MAKVAFVGLGVMGYPMAGHLKARSHPGPIIGLLKVGDRMNLADFFNDFSRARMRVRAVKWPVGASYDAGQ